MKKEVAINTFDKGMIRDLNPIVTPSNVLTYCLNGTTLTFNGNENVLLNDMGNGRVETAYLPEGYVPLGTAELGGIIYIVSYNPLSNKCLVGSFPSPERNISSDEVSSIVCTLDNNNFKWSALNGAYVYYLKKDLDSELIFNPGDKFIVYGDSINGNYLKLYDETKFNSAGFDTAKNYTIKLDVGTVTESGKLVKFSDLKKYKIGNLGKYHIYQYEGSSLGTKPDIDDYRGLTSQPYNIFSSKVSGRLVLIAELVLCNTFDIELSHVFTQDSIKNYIPNVLFNFEGEYPFIPLGVKCEFELLKNSSVITTDSFFFDTIDSAKSTIQKSNTSYNITCSDILLNVTKIRQLITNIANSGYFTLKNRNSGYVLRYTFTPCMNWGSVSYLAITGSIDLDKLGTGYIGLNNWRYYKLNDKISLTWGLDVYEEEGYRVTEVSMDLSRLIGKNVVENTVYTISRKSSYHGVFYDVLPLDLEYFRFKKPLVSNSLYLVKIQVTYQLLSNGSKTKVAPTIKTFYRWLYTNEVFNEHYVNTSDFRGLTLSFTPSFSLNYTSESNTTDTVDIYGILNKTIEGVSDENKNNWKSSKTSLSGILKEKTTKLSCDLIIGITKPYNTFHLKCIQDAFSFALDETKMEASCASNIKYTEREDSELDNYLFSEPKTLTLKDSLGTYKLNASSGSDVSDSLLKKDNNKFPTNVIKLTGTSVNPSFSNNIYSFNINYDSLLLVKAYCTKIESALQYTGRLIPLAYDAESFALYNIELLEGSTHFTPTKYGTYSFHEDGGRRGTTYIGHADKNSPNSLETLLEHSNDVDLNWTNNENIINLEQLHGWSNTAIFAVHWNGGNGSRLRIYLSVNNKDVWYSEAMTEYHGKHGKTRVQLMLKSNNTQYFYPIDFSDSCGADSYDELNSMLKNYYDAFASILNNLYRYDSEAFSSACLIPLYIYYMDNCTYELNIPIAVKSTPSLSKCGILLDFSDGNVDLHDIISTFINLGVIDNSSEIRTILTPNVTYTFQSSNTTYKLNVKDSDNSSGVALRNHILDLLLINMNVGVFDYDGRSVLTNSAANYNKTKLYYIKKDGTATSVKLAKSVPFKSFNYALDSNKNIIRTGENTHNLKNSENFNSRLTLNDDGLLILKDPPTSELEMCRDGNDDTGNVRGFQKVRFVNKYRYYS